MTESQEGEGEGDREGDREGEQRQPEEEAGLAHPQQDLVRVQAVPQPPSPSAGVREGDRALRPGMEEAQIPQTMSSQRRKIADMFRLQEEAEDQEIVRLLQMIPRMEGMEVTTTEQLVIAHLPNKGRDMYGTEISMTLVLLKEM